MLNIITGRTGSGKTRYIRHLAAEIAEQTANKAVIIVPEQFSFETERAMLGLLGNAKINNVEILSFSRLAERLLKENGMLRRKCADDGIRAVLMSLAIEALEDKITVFSRYRRRPALISELLDFYREMKKCCISNEQLSEMAQKVKKTSFSERLNELSLIFSCYDAMMSQSFGDDCLYLDMLYELLSRLDFFSGKHVFIDAFSGFSAQEYNIIERIAADCDELYVTFCCDTEKNNGRYDLFYNSMTEIKKLKAVARRANIKIAPETVLHAKREYKSEPLNVLEDSIFDASNNSFEGACDCITVMSARSAADESTSVAAEIKRLVREEGYRYRDIAVIERTDGSYKNELASSFRKYGIDCYEDARQPVATQPLMVFMLSLFDILTDGFSAESVFRLLKTGLYGFSVEDIALLEDYCAVWNVRGSQWNREWTENPDGFGVEFTDSNRKKLVKINELRASIVAPVTALKGKITDVDGETVSREMFAFIRRVHVDENLKQLTQLLKANGESELAGEQGRIWQILCDILDGLYRSVGKSAVSVRRYRELFEIIVATKDIGEIPNGADEVIIGSADRIRASAPRAVFIVGANMGVFPKDSGGGVLLNNIERCELQENGADIVSNLEYNSVSEMFIAYRAVTLATEKLFISYSAVDSSAQALAPSQLVSEIMRIFPKCRIADCKDKLKKIESKSSAFSVLAEEIGENSVLATTIYKYFDDIKNGFSGEIAMIDKIRRTKYSVSDPALAEELFGKSMYISASKTEKFYKCPFEYFCEFGIRARPRREAEMDPAQTGTLVHYVLERLLREIPKEVLIKCADGQIREKTDEIIDEYVRERLSGYADKPQSFLRGIKLIKENSYQVALRIIDEFAHSRFVPADFELSINNDGEILPYTIDIGNGNTVKIIGSVDRADVYKTEDNTFVRVIDYKTGGKTFSLGEVFSGLNMQMLIYLFAIWQNGHEHYGNVVPAGILYFQAKNPKLGRSKLSRDAGSEKVSAELKKGLKMSGMVLNNIDVIDAMERDGAGVFIPASIDKNGNASGSVISLQSLSRLEKKVDGLIRDMAGALKNGEIDAYPTEHACRYCQYRAVCKREEDCERREIPKISFNDALNMLGDDDDEQMD